MQKGEKTEYNDIDPRILTALTRQMTLFENELKGMKEEILKISEKIDKQGKKHNKDNYVSMGDKQKQIYDYIKRKKIVKLKQIHKWLNEIEETTYPALGMQLKELINKGKIEKVAHGTYAVVDTAPNPAKMHENT